MRKLILASLTISSTLTAQTPAAKPRTTPLKGSLERRLATLLDQPPFNRANWGLYVVDDRGKVLFERNGDRFYVPASNTKLVVSAAATVLLPVDYRVKTSLYTNGRMDNGVLHGDLVLYGRRGGPAAQQHLDPRPRAVHVREPGPHRAGGLQLDGGRQLLPEAGHVGHLGGGDRGARSQAVDRELRAPRPQPLCGPGARGFLTKEGHLGRGGHGEHHRLTRLPRCARLLRAAGRVRRPPAPGHRLPDPELEPELVRRNAAQAAGPRAQRRGVVERGARGGAPLPHRFRANRLDGVRAGGRLGARRGESGDAARVRPAARLHASPPEACALPRRAAPRGAARLPPQTLRGDGARRAGDREDGQHRSGEQPLRLHRTTQWTDRHVQHPGEHARRSLSADARAEIGRASCRERV